MRVAALLGLHAIFAFGYLHQHLNRGLTEGYALAVLICVWIIGFTWLEWRQLKGQVNELLGLKPSPPASTAP